MSREPHNPWPGLGGRMVIAPSLLAADFARLGEQIDQVIAAGADVLHVDIMDGHFVPNLSMGPGFAASVRKYTDHPLDVHLMVSDPAYYTERFAEAGADSITVHIEATDDPAGLIESIRSRGLGAGITLKPGTEAQSLAPVIEMVDMVLVMTVEPGYGGQKFMADQLGKIAAIRAMLRDDQRLEVDGGIKPPTAGQCAAHGADTFVAGVDIFRSDDPSASVQALRDGAEQGLSPRPVKEDG